MQLSKCAILAGLVAMTSICSTAQHKFPLRNGEWAYTTPSLPGDPIMFCFSDELWEKGLTRNKVCTISDVNVSATAISYSMDCPTKSYEIKGVGTMTFDGQEHMVGKATLTTIMNGKSTPSEVTGDYRWKSSQCSPNDANLRARKPQ